MSAEQRVPAGQRDLRQVDDRQAVEIFDAARSA